MNEHEGSNIPEKDRAFVAPNPDATEDRLSDDARTGAVTETFREAAKRGLWPTVEEELSQLEAIAERDLPGEPKQRTEKPFTQRNATAAKAVESREPKRVETISTDVWEDSVIQQYDEKNQPASWMIDVRRRFDEQGRMVSKEETVSQARMRSGIDALHSFGVPDNQRTDIEYTPDGRIRQEAIYEDGLGDQWRHKKVREHMLEEDGRTTIHIRDGKGHLTRNSEVVSADRTRIDYHTNERLQGHCAQTFDDSGRLVQQAFYDAQGRLGATKTYVYLTRAGGGLKSTATIIRDAKGEIVKQFTEWET